jgi:lipopolysaccharide export system protein LptA
MAWSSLSTGSRTLLVGLGLAVIYFGYSRLTSPWLRTEQKRLVPTVSATPQEKSTVFSELASRWFSDVPWVQTASGRFRDNGRLLFFNDYELFNKNRSIRINPVALLWEQKKGEVPITATAESAQLDASTEFSFSQGQFGKITSGLLAGAVRITGPDNLRIDGQTFYISDDAMKVWSRHPVMFAWETHSGIADGGVEIELLASPDSTSAGLMAITDVRKILLLGRIKCDLRFQDDDPDREPVELSINAANGFEFFVPTMQATFYGFLDRKLEKDNQILIQRPAPDGNLDRLFCSKLVLQLQPKIQSPDARKKQSNQMKLAKITAEGQRVVFYSQKEDIKATMSQLKYHIEERLLELLGRVATSSEAEKPVEIHQSGRQLTAGRVLVAHDDHNNVHTIECRGSGKIGRSHLPVESDHDIETAEKNAVDASWTESLLLTNSDQQRVTLRGNARVTQPLQQLSLTGQVIEMVLERTVDAENSGSTALGKNSGLSVSNLRPQLLTASSDVRIVSPEMTGTARERMSVLFREPSDSSGSRQMGAELSDPAGSPANAVRPVSQSSEKTPPLAGTTEFASDTVETAVILTPAGQPQFEDVWLKGKVSVTHDSTKKDESFTAEGNVLFARAGFRGDREISLFGDPATVIHARDRIEGQRIDLTELKRNPGRPQREARVEGSGRIRFVLNVGLDGKTLDRPSPLDIYWGDHMSFSGRTAHFVGNIRAVMNNETDHDVELTCAGMKVHFQDEVQLNRSGRGDEFQLAQSSTSKSPAGDIELIECDSRVIVDIDMMKNGIVEAHHHAEFTDLKFNTLTGGFHALGPGLIESTQPDTGRKLTTPNRAVASANTPARTSENAFVFIHARFIGELQGNVNEKYVHLRQHVRGLFGPVRTLSDRISIDGLSVEQLPENTGSLGCENLSISAIPGATSNRDSFSLVAESNAAGGNKGTRSPCRLESKQFAGDADKITYDHSKQQFILRGDEGREAKVSYRQNGGEPQILRGGRFEYYSDRNELNANQITGVQASGGP